MIQIAKKMAQAARSRTFWTIVAMFLINGIAAIHSDIPAQAMPVVDSILALLATYFHLNPSQDYNS